MSILSLLKINPLKKFKAQLLLLLRECDHLFLMLDEYSKNKYGSIEGVSYPDFLSAEQHKIKEKLEQLQSLKLGEKVRANHSLFVEKVEQLTKEVQSLLAALQKYSKAPKNQELFGVMYETLTEKVLGEGYGLAEENITV